jgi:hypothetical protein
MAKQVYIFKAQLVGHRGVRRTIGMRRDQRLADLSDALQAAFGWYEEHLYSFWLGGEFWGRDGTEYTHPSHAAESGDFAFGRARKSAATTLDRLELKPGQRIAYVFDFGDEWRVRLTLTEIKADDGQAYPLLLDSAGAAPPQYPDYDEDAA